MKITPHHPLRAIFMITAALVFASGDWTACANGETGPGFRIGYAEGLHLEPSVGLAANGNAVVAWRGRAEGREDEVLAQRIGPDDALIGSGIVVDIGNSTLGTPRVAVAPNGRFAITFRGRGVGGDPVVVSYAEDGTSQWRKQEPISVNNLGYEDIAIDNSGNVRLVFGNSAGALELHSFDPSGNRTSVVVPGLNPIQSRFAMHEDGSFAIAYQNANSIVTRSYDAAGQFLASEVQPSFSSITGHDVAATANGEYVIAVVTSSRTLHVAEAVTSGARRSQQLNFLPGHVSIAGAGVAGKGDLIVAWDEVDADGDVTAYAQRFFQGLSRAGGRIVLERRFFGGIFPQPTSRAAVAMNSAGEALVAYSEVNSRLLLPGEPIPPPSRGIPGRRFAALPNPLCAIPSPGPTEELFPARFLTSRGAAHRNSPHTACTQIVVLPDGSRPLYLKFGPGQPIVVSENAFVATVVMSTESEAVVFWSHSGGLSARKFSLNLQTDVVAPVTGIVDYSNVPAAFDLATDGLGKVVLAYVESDLEGISFGVLNANLFHFAASIPLPASRLSAHGIALDMNVGGEVALLYNHYLPGQSTQNIQLERFDALLVSTGVATLSTSAARLEPLDVAINGDGEVLGIWRSQAEGLIPAPRLFTAGQFVGSAGNFIGHRFYADANPVPLADERPAVCAMSDGSFVYGTVGAGTIVRHAADGMPTSLALPPAPGLFDTIRSLAETESGRLAVFWEGLDLSDTVSSVKQTIVGTACWLAPSILVEVDKINLSASAIQGFDSQVEQSGDLKKWSVGEKLRANPDGRYEMSLTPDEKQGYFRMRLVPSAIDPQR